MINFMPGSTIYAIPTGNNASRSKEIVNFVVIKKKRKYVELSQNGSTNPSNYCMRTGMEQGGSRNSGYVFFESMNALVQHKAHGQRIKYLKKFFNWDGGIKLLSRDDTEAIHNIISKHIKGE